MLAFFLLGGSEVAAARLPANLIISPKAEPHHVLLVEKSSQRLFIYRFDGEYRLVATYTCATGENAGDKQISGDQKTPEGVYFFTKAVGGENLSPIYGARAFPTNYPNNIDRRHNKKGNGIWVHGTNEKLKARSTNGCVALTSPNVIELGAYIKLWDTPIIIEEKIVYEDSDRLRQQGLDLYGSIEDWRRAWSGKELDRYLFHYASDFRWKNLDLTGWRQKKERLNQTYGDIAIQLKDIRMFRQGGVVVTTADELYRSDKYASRGIKQLYLAEKSRGWRILGEEWRKSNHPIPAPLALAVSSSKTPKPSEKPENDLRRVLEQWRRAWEVGDLSSYLAFYHPGFKARGMDLPAWQKLKQERFEDSPKRVIRLNDIEVKVSGSSALVVANQAYRADSYQDYGRKTLRLGEHRGRWVILRENWQALPDGG